jgi:hypothetical protein
VSCVSFIGVLFWWLAGAGHKRLFFPRGAHQPPPPLSTPGQNDPPAKKQNQQALTPIVEGIIRRDMERFREYAEREYAAALAARARKQQQQQQQQQAKA